MVCFDMMNAGTLERVGRWREEVRRNTEEAYMDEDYSLVLVGCKYDMWLEQQNHPNRVTIQACHEVSSTHNNLLQ